MDESFNDIVKKSISISPPNFSRRVIKHSQNGFRIDGDGCEVATVDFLIQPNFIDNRIDYTYLLSYKSVQEIIVCKILDIAAEKRSHMIRVDLGMVSTDYKEILDIKKFDNFEFAMYNSTDHIDNVHIETDSDEVASWNFPAAYTKRSIKTKFVPGSLLEYSLFELLDMLEFYPFSAMAVRVWFLPIHVQGGKTFEMKKQALSRIKSCGI